VRQKERGFSLVELLVAMVLGLILIAGVTQVFIGNRQTQTVEQSLARVQESGRLALRFIEEDMRLAGFYGGGRPPNAWMNTTDDPSCPNMAPNDVFNVAMGYDQYNDYRANAIRVFSKSAAGTWAPSVPPTGAPGWANDISAATVANARNGSDLVVLFYAVDTGAQVNLATGATMSGPTSAAVPVTRNNACFETGELVMLANQSSSVIFRVTNDPGCTTPTVSLQHAALATGNCTANLYGDITSESRVLKLRHFAYYVGNTGRTNVEGSPVFALYRSANGGPAEELVEGIEFLKLTYGEQLLDANNERTGRVRYTDAAGIANPLGISSARIGVLVQGFDAARDSDDINAYELPGLIIDHDGSGIDHGGGRTLRRVFTANVELRNKAQ
jgi:type IV pilus assembly protein PilW